MPTFDAAEAAKDDPLRLPIPGGNGVVTIYEIPVLDAAGLIELAQLERSVRLISVGLGADVPDTEKRKLDAMTQRQHVDLVLSVPTVELMIANKIDQRMFTAAAVTAQTWHLRGLNAAIEAWDVLAVNPGRADADPKAKSRARNGGGNTNPTTANISSSRKRSSRRKGKARAGHG